MTHDPDAAARRDHRRGHHPQVAEDTRATTRRARRAAVRDLDRQGRHRGPLAGRRHRDQDPGRRGRDGAGRTPTLMEIDDGVGARPATNGPADAAGAGGAPPGTEAVAPPPAAPRLRRLTPVGSAGGGRGVGDGAMPDRGPRSQILSPIVRRLARGARSSTSPDRRHRHRRPDHQERRRSCDRGGRRGSRHGAGGGGAGRSRPVRRRRRRPRRWRHPPLQPRRAARTSSR